MALLDQGDRREGRPRQAARHRRPIVAKQTLRRDDGEPQTETTNYIEYPDHFRVEAAGTRAGLRRLAGLGRRISAASTMLPTARDARVSLRRDVIALLLAANDGALTTRLLPDVKDAEGHITHTLELSAPRPQPGRPLHRSADPPDHQAGIRGRRAGRPLVEEQFSDYRRVDGVQIAFQATRTVGDRSVRAKRQRREDQRAGRPACSNAPRLEPARAAVVRRGVGRSLRRRADARAARARPRRSPSRASAVPQFAAAGGVLVDDYREHQRHRTHSSRSPSCRGWSTPRRRLVAAAARRAARRAGADRFLRLQLPRWRRRSRRSACRWSTTSARRSGRGAASGSTRSRRIADRVLVIFPFEEAIYRRAGVAGRVRRPSADRPREAVSAARRVPRRARAVAVGADDRHAARQPRERGDADPADARRGGSAHSRCRARRAIRRRPRAAPRRMRCSIRCARQAPTASPSSTATPTPSSRRPMSR